MKRVKLPEAYLETMANVIRQKTGSSSLMTPRQMIGAVDAMVLSGETPVIIVYENEYTASFMQIIIQSRTFESHFNYDEPNYYASCEEII